MEYGMERSVEGITSIGDETVKYYRYPLFNSKRYGNFQANGPINAIKPFIGAINHSINPPPPTGVSIGIQALSASHCQGYNTLSHHFRNQGSANQDASRADVTASMAAPYAEGKVAADKAAKLHDYIIARFPHQRFWLKVKDIDHDNLALRLENTYHIDLERLPNHIRSGR